MCRRRESKGAPDDEPPSYRELSTPAPFARATKLARNHSNAGALGSNLDPRTDAASRLDIMFESAVTHAMNVGLPLLVAELADQERAS